jgi:D-glycero-alpha-D-manno-heptose 1-phosphate guanylyltransferase
MEAVVLAGGLGTRLRGVVRDLPKPLAPVAGRPFITYLLERLERHGFASAILSVGYMADTISAVLGTGYGRMALRYCLEAKPLGTGGGMRLALAMPSDFPVLVLNGDTLVDVDYGEVVQSHIRSGAALSVVVRRVEDASRYGRAVVREGRIVGFEAAGTPGPGLISGGIYVFSRNLLADMPEKFSFESDFLESRVATLQPHAFETSSYFIDIGVPQDYARAQQELAEPLRP